MAPANTISSRADVPDDLVRSVESAYSQDLRPEAEAAFRQLDHNVNLEMSSYGTTPEHAPREYADTTIGEPISARDLFSSDQAYEIAESATEEHHERSHILLNIGERLASLRNNF